MSDHTIGRLRKLAVAGLVAAGLSGCVSDPAFMEGLAVFADTLAAETSRCYYRTNVWGYSEYYCPPAYTSAYGSSYGAPVYVAPVYVPPSNNWRDRRDRHDRRDWRRDRGGRDHDRGGRRGGRRGGKD